MKDLLAKLLEAFEVHSPEQIRDVLDAGLSVTQPVAGKTPIAHLAEMYFRSDRFPACVRLLLERGATLEDPKLAAVLLNDPRLLEEQYRMEPSLLRHRTSMASAFTPMDGASLLHVAAEYGHLAVAAKLLELGADVDARADTDSYGMNGHTPLFHTVNSNANRSAPVMRLLLSAGAQADVRLPGITWGRGFEWETTCFDVTPVSYAQLGLLPQMHRTEEHCYANVRELLMSCGRSVPPLPNVPNRYLTR